MKHLLKRDKKGAIKLVYVIIICLVLILFLLFSIYLYSFSKFKTGDFVYNNQTGAIGEIKGVSLPMNYLIQWQDGSFSQESLVSSNTLTKLNNYEIETLLKKENNYESSLYLGPVKGRGIISEEPVDVTNFTSLEIIEGLEGKGNFVLFVGSEGCKPNFVCGNWGECQEVYGLNSLIGEELVSTLQYRYCKDYSGCITDFFDSRRCEIKTSISLRNVTIGGKNYINVYNQDKILVSRLGFSGNENQKLNIQIPFDREE
jgi:hypothetical protein